MSDDSSSDDSLPLSAVKRQRILSSSSDSSEDSDVPIRRRRLNRQRVVSMLDESSDENDSDILERRNDTISSESSDEDSTSPSKSPKKAPNVDCVNGNMTDSSEGNSDKCPICLLSFSKQNVGTPENCEHLFCADCITEWSKNVNTCPVDRLTFNKILVRQRAGGKVIKTIPVSPRRPSEEEYFIEDTTYCEICHLSDSEETMLLCDSCDLGYHMHCLSPPLTEVPETEWFCPRCIRRGITATDEDSEALLHVLDLDNADLTLNLMSHLINVTTETLNRIDRMTRNGDPTPSTSGSTSGRTGSGRNGRALQRNRTSNNTITRRRYRRRHRARTRTVVVEYETRDNGKFPIKVTKRRIKRRRRKKRTTRRGGPRTAARRALVRSSIRGRLAEQNQQAFSNSEGSNGINSLAVPRLSLYGNPNELDYFEDSEIDDIDIGTGRGGVAVAATSRSMASAILDSYRQVRRKMVSIPSPQYASTAPDILSTIMESQTMLHSKKPPDSNSSHITSKTKPQTPALPDALSDKKVDVKNTSADLNVKSAPGYPGAGGGGRGMWRGGQMGYQSHGNDNRGNYSNNYHGNRGDDNSYQGNRSFNSPWQGGNAGGHDNFQRQEQFDYLDRSPVQRNSPNVNNRGRGGQFRFSQLPQQRPQMSPWRNQNELSAPFSGPPPSAFPPPLCMDMSSNPVDMTTSQDNMGYNIGGTQSNYQDMNVYQTPQTAPPAISHTTPLPPPPQPPIIRFQRPPLSDDETSEPSQHEEPDKYDPTEPTLDDSGSEEDLAPRPINIVHNKITIVSPPRKDNSLVAEYGSGSESPKETTVSEIRNFDDAAFEPHEPDTSEGCPNFSIYSSTIDIIRNKQTEPQNELEPSVEDREEDLVQEDDIQCDDTYLPEQVNDVNSIPVPPDDWKSQNVEDEWAEGTNEECDDTGNEDYDENNEDVNVEEQLASIFNDVQKDPANAAEETDKTAEKTEEKDKYLENNDLSKTASDVPYVKSNEPMTSFRTPPKRTPIQIKLLTNRGITKSLYDKEDSPSLNASVNDANKGNSDDEMSSTTNQQRTHSDEEDRSADDEVKKINSDGFGDNIDKLTECISDVEDERSYTPCLDEKTKDSTFENEKDNMGIEGLDTEMISEDEGNDIFSDLNNQRNDSDGGALELSVRESELQPGEFEEGEIVEKHKQKVKEKVKALLKQPNKDNISDDERKKKKRDKKGDKDGKEKLKNKGKRGNEDSEGFKKLSKSNKERNYRDRDDKTKMKNKEKRFSKSPEVDKENRKEKENKAREKKREKKKDIERYDVRTIISEKGRRVKDAFGRDTSRPRSKSPDSPRFRRSPSRRRSSSFGRRSLSRGRRSPSRTRRSISRGRQSLSRRRRSISRGRVSPPRRRRSGSRPRSIVRFGRSMSPRRSASLRPRRSVSPRQRNLRSPRRQSMSRDRSPIRRRSISPQIRRSKSPKIRLSVSRGKVKRGKRSVSRGRINSPRLRRESPPRRRLSRRSRSRLRSISKNRSVSPKPRKARKLNNKRKKSKSPHKLKQKRRSRSFSPGIILSRSPSPNRVVHEPWVREKSPLYREWSSGSPSMSPVRNSPGWTPPPQRRKSPQPDNLRVILTTKDKIKKKDKKKKSNKHLKANERLLQQQKDSGPCKEVFTSGNNILVSVSFNKNQESQDGPEIPQQNGPPKKKKHKTDTVKSKKDKNKEKSKKRRGDKNKKSKDDENKKPVAIIDLDKSPFKELTPSPKAVIILSDSENGEKEEELMERQEIIRGELLQMGFPQCDDHVSPRRSPVRENVYAPPAGPKTPPEPAIKFTIANKANPQLRAVNPLHEEEEEVLQETTEEKQDAEKRPADAAHKGPNTPPDPPNSPPSSPDAYDPFEPTRSGSATPERPSSPQPEKRSEDLLQVPSMSLEAAQKSNLSADDVIQARPISPMEKVLALLKSTRNNVSPANATQPLYSEQIFDNTRSSEVESQQMTQQLPVVSVQSPEKASVMPTVTKSQVISALVKPNSPKLIYSSVAPTVVTSSAAFLNLNLPRIPIYNTGTPPNPRIILPSPTKSSPLKISNNKLFVGKPSPIKSTPIKPMPSKTIISKLPMPAIKPLPPRSNTKDKGKNGQNGNDIIDLDLDMDSPYSPGSSDFGDLFDPPADNGKHNNTYAPTKSGNTFDSLFSSKPSVKLTPKSTHTKVTVKQTKKPKGHKVGVRMDEDSLRILDDLPSSAVELQVKTKFLKKLNRQERVVEEVKLVLKPHYTKKHISKEDYKEILRRAVPKICHNRSGEINPAKIHSLIEAYVKKFRKKAHMVK